jgi:nifR3 family TIM-barrel protein
MSGNFWSELKKPIFVLAPMANVTDAAFRRIIAKYSRPAGPAVFWTEFVSVEGLLSRGREKLLPDLWFTPGEHPIVAQIFGGKPEQFYEIAPLLVKLGFDGVDINMGCPHDGVVKSCAGSDLIKDPQRAKEIITELKRGIKDAGSDIPVSVKTRIGYNKNEMETWLPAILEAGVSALTVHLRTRKEMSAVPAHWELMPRIVELRNKYAPETVLLGNGDVKDLVDARQKVLDTGCDGVMLGRAIFGNPWLFREAEKPRPSVASGEGGLPYIPTTEEKLRVAVEHTKLFMEILGPIKPFDFMKKHFKAYVNGFDGAKELRVKMMEAESVEEIESLVNEFLKR